ncbi:MAG TPA: CHAD domain-containing protein [Vicinamibacterales bacterium]
MPSRHPLRRSLARRVDALATHLPRAVEGEPVGVHRARVATRRLRELIPIVGADLPSRRVKRIRKRLRRLTRALGPVREQDVTLPTLEAMASGAADAFDEVRERLAREREARLAFLQHHAGTSKANRLVAKLRRLEEDLEPATAWRDALARRLTGRARALRAAIAEAGALFAAERLHAVRIAVKKLRYVLEIAGDARVAPTAALVSRLRDVQATLGRLHDLDVLRDRLQQASADAEKDAAAIDAVMSRVLVEMRGLHAEYLRQQPRIIRVADRTLDHVVPRVEARHAPPPDGSDNGAGEPQPA